MNQFDAIIALLENSSFYYIITTNMTGTYSYINSHYAKTFSYIHDTIVGQPYQITMHPDDIRVCEEVSLKCFNNPARLYPATIRKHDGKGGFVITQWEYKAMFNDSGEPEGIFCLGYDITKFVGEEKELKVAKSEIERREHLMKEIAFQHSHLIRSPLSNILGLTAVLRQMEVDSNVKNICQMIIESSLKLDEIIREVVLKSFK